MLLEIHSETIISTVAQVCNVTVEQIKGTCRKRDYVNGRHLSMYFMKKLCKQASLKEIGNAIGGRDHSTAIHSIGQAEALFAYNDEFRALFERVQERLPKIDRANSYNNSGICPYVFPGLKLGVL